MPRLSTPIASELTDEELRALIKRMNADPMSVYTDVQSPAGLRKDIPAVAKPQTMTDEELKTFVSDPAHAGQPQMAPTGPVAVEQQMRTKTAGRSFVSNLLDPETTQWAAGRLLKQVGAGAVTTIDLPASFASIYGIGAMGAEKLADMLTPPQDSNLPPVVHDFGSKKAFDFANDQYRKALEVVGVSPPRDFAEGAASMVGSLIPIPTPTKLTGALKLAEYVTPFVIGKGNLAPRLALNWAAGTTINEGIQHVLDTDGTYNDIFEQTGLLPAGSDMTPWQIAATAAAVTAPMWGPMALHAMATQRVKPPVIRPITEVDRTGPENLYTMTTTKDVLKGIIFDDKDVLTDIAKRAGVSDPDFVRKMIGYDTQAAGQVKANEAMSSGKMHSAFGDFQTPVPPKELMKAFSYLDPVAQADYEKYFQQGAYSDILRRRIAGKTALPSDRRELLAARKFRAAMRLQYPGLAEYSKGVQQYTEGVRNFLSTGPYAIMPPGKTRKFNQVNKHFVPFDTEPVEASDPLLHRLKSAEDAPNSVFGKGHVIPAWLDGPDIEGVTAATLAMNKGAIPQLTGYGHSALTAQLHNNARGVWIDQVLGSSTNQGGTPLIRLATKAERTDPDQASRIVQVYRNGKPEYYITEKYIANAIKFDPAILTGIGAMVNKMRRVYETGVTGVLSPVFPLTTGIRDTFGGWVNTPKGAKGPGWGTAIEPFRVLGAKFTHSLYTDIMAQLDAGKGAWQLPGMDEASQRQLAARLSAVYQNTMYHAAQAAGGVDASILRERTVYAAGKLREMAQVIPKPLQVLYGRALSPLMHGLSAIIGSTAEAPRANAFRRNVNAGMLPDEAAEISRELTGDTMRSGRAVTNAGKGITGDVVNPQLAALLLGPARVGAAVGRTAVPWTNPTLQGIRRVARAAAEAPGRTVMRSWLAIGLPSVASYAWNALLSKGGEHDYVDYDMNVRSGHDQVMNQYIALPGLPPEQGLEIPIAHENIPFLSPFKTMIHHLGGGGQEMMDALTYIGGNIMENAFGVPTPPMVAALQAAAGAHPTENLANPFQQTYDIREDNVGLLSENVEQTLRALFGNAADMGLKVAASMSSPFDLQHGMDEFINQVASRTPIVKNIGGWKTNSAAFTPVSNDDHRKLAAWDTFDKYWQQYYGHPGLVGSVDDANDATREATDPITGERIEVPYAKLGDEPLAKPTNPIYELLGQQIEDAVRKKDTYGFPVTKKQLSALTKQLQLLRGFNSGRSGDFRSWQAELADAPKYADQITKAYQDAQAEYESFGRSSSPEKAAAAAKRDKAKDALITSNMYIDTNNYIKKNKIDLGNRFDVIRLTNKLEQNRVSLMRVQLSLIKQIEDDLTQQLLAQGFLQPGQHFSFEKDLAPMANPVTQGAPQSPPGLGATAPAAN